jgi:hypothetical protein
VRLCSSLKKVNYEQKLVKHVERMNDRIPVQKKFNKR